MQELSANKAASFCSSTQGAYYTQPVYAAQPHVIHHTTVVQPNSIPSAIYPAPVAAPRTNGVAMGMVAGTTMAMSAGENLKGKDSCCSRIRFPKVVPMGAEVPPSLLWNPLSFSESGWSQCKSGLVIGHPCSNKKVFCSCSASCIH